jgi:hypothetical protein
MAFKWLVQRQQLIDKHAKGEAVNLPTKMSVAVALSQIQLPAAAKPDGPPVHFLLFTATSVTPEPIQ